MKLILIHLMYLAPVILEAFVIDPWFWRHKKDDKPLSNYTRAAILAGVAVIGRYVFHDNYLVMCFLLPFVWYMAFPYLVNWQRDKPFFYLANGWWDRLFKKLHNWPRLWLQIIVVLVVLMAYLYLNSTIYQGYTILFNIPRFK